MDQKLIFGKCKELGCCDACSLRYLGVRNPRVYENPKEFALKFQGEPVEIENNSSKVDTTETADYPTSNGDAPPNKKHKSNPCVTCLGVLQESVWPECYKKVKDMLDRKRYECATFACALSAPIVTILREKAVSLWLSDICKDYDPKTLTPLKEAWKWSFCNRLAAHLGIALDAGNVSPLLVTLNMEYADDLQELEVLKGLSPDLFESRSRQKKRFSVEFTRRSVEQALEGVTLTALRAGEGEGERAGWGQGVPAATAPVACVSVSCTHAPVYLGGRYIKLSRELPQTPWVVNGRRVMESSVQEIIFEPIANMYGMSAAESERRLKLVSAGREDVDVRCLGGGRPFAVEVADPSRELSAEELSSACAQISASGKVVVNELVPVTKQDLAELKKGEQSKCKTYEALCIKLTSDGDGDGDGDDAVPGECGARVTAADIARVNAYRNVGEAGGVEGVEGEGGAAPRVRLEQRTPLRVLHRRPLRARTRYIYEMHAQPVPEHPQLLVLRVRTSAGAYVKEFVHGELARTRPALSRGVLPARLDLLALDVTRVHLDWPAGR